MADPFLDAANEAIKANCEAKRAVRIRQLDFFIMYLNLMGSYMTIHIGEFEQDIVGLVLPNITELRANLVTLLNDIPAQ